MTDTLGPEEILRMKRQIKQLLNALTEIALLEKDAFYLQEADINLELAGKIASEAIAKVEGKHLMPEEGK